MVVEICDARIGRICWKTCPIETVLQWSSLYWENAAKCVCTRDVSIYHHGSQQLDSLSGQPRQESRNGPVFFLTLALAFAVK